MKKSFTIFKILFVALFAFIMMNVSAQIANLNTGVYYQIINRVAGNALAIDHERVMEEGALVEQQEPNEFLPTQLWQIIPLTETTYNIINYGTGMALGLSDWRGINPFWTGSAAPTSEEKDAALMVPTFDWHGWHRGVVQRTFAEGEPTQIWEPTQFPDNSVSGDTVFYRMTMAMDLVDSGFCFNIWERRILPGYRDICAFPGTQENDLYIDATSLYAWYFQPTSTDVETGIAEFLRERINVYSKDGAVILSGELYNRTVEVYSILGASVYSAKANSSILKIPVEPGIYIVKSGKLVTKLLVR